MYSFDFSRLSLVTTTSWQPTLLNSHLRRFLVDSRNYSLASNRSSIFVFLVGPWAICRCSINKSPRCNLALSRPSKREPRRSSRYEKFSHNQVLGRRVTYQKQVSDEEFRGKGVGRTLMSSKNTVCHQMFGTWMVAA